MSKQVMLVYSRPESVLERDHRHVVRPAFQIRYWFLLAGHRAQVTSLKKKIDIHVGFMIKQKD